MTDYIAGFLALIILIAVFAVVTMTYGALFVLAASFWGYKVSTPLALFLGFLVAVGKAVKE